MTSPATHPLAADRTPALAHLARVRVAGVLTLDAQLYPGDLANPFLQLQIRPLQGLPYLARVLLGTDPTDYMLAQAELPRLKAGTLVSVAGDALALQHDHGNAVLRLVHARDLVVFSDPITPTPAATPAPTPNPRTDHVL